MRRVREGKGVRTDRPTDRPWDRYPPPNSEFLLTKNTHIDHVRDCVWQANVFYVFANSQIQIAHPYGRRPPACESSLESVYTQELSL